MGISEENFQANIASKILAEADGPSIARTESQDHSFKAKIMTGADFIELKAKSEAKEAEKERKKKAKLTKVFKVRGGKRGAGRRKIRGGVHVGIAIPLLGLNLGEKDREAVSDVEEIPEILANFSVAGEELSDREGYISQE